MKPLTIDAVRTYLSHLQNTICQMLVTEDGTGQFKEDCWQKADGQGNGVTCVMENGPIIEKAGVNFSHVYGDLPAVITKQKPELLGHRFQAMGVSSVIHPRNPYAPTAHMNVRFFVAEKAGQEPTWWFGGGFDLTPYYGFVEDCVHWHKTAKQACEPFGKNIYAEYKKACDDYFFLKHRNEPRGIGGLFFDHLNKWGFEQCFAFMQSIGNHFIKAYQPILARRKNLSYQEREREFQIYRRGRYVEFNLIHDRGTLFGLETDGRTESILISLPPQVSWRYNFKPLANTPEAKLYEEFLLAKDWLSTETLSVR